MGGILLFLPKLAILLSFKSCPRVGGIKFPTEVRDWFKRFKSCPRVGGILLFLPKLAILLSFKSCPRVGGIRRQKTARSKTKSFKSCPRVGGIPMVFGKKGSGKRFQVVPPCGGHPHPSQPVSLADLRFKSCPRVGGIETGGKQKQRSRVSSRAPVWGASFPQAGIRRTVQPFQVVPPCGGHHARPQRPKKERVSFKSCPRVGGIHRRRNSSRKHERFQVVPPCGGHLRTFCENLKERKVSSRAPVWGASYIEA